MGHRYECWDRKLKVHFKILEIILADLLNKAMTGRLGIIALTPRML